METTVQAPANGLSGREYPSPVQAEPPAAAYLPIILQSLETMKNGDFSVRLPVTWVGLTGKIADCFNEIVTANQQMALELKRVGQAVGKEGKTQERIRLERRRGAWDDMEVSVNAMVEDLLFLDVHGRVAKKLLELAETNGARTPEGIRIEMKLTQSDLAAMVGASRESVNKVMSYLLDKQYVSVEKRKITVMRLAELRNRIC